MTENNEPINSNIIDKSGFIVGFLASVFILYSFKDFFDKYRLDFGLFNLSLTNLVVGFISLLLLSMYLYAINYIRYDFLQLLSIKKLKYIELSAHFVYLTALLLYPAFVILVWILNSLFRSIYDPLDYEIKEVITTIVLTIIPYLGVNRITKLLLKRRKYIRSELKAERDNEFEYYQEAKKHSDKYTAILEIYQAIIDSLKFELFEQVGLDSRKLHGSKVIKIAKEVSLISEEDYNYLFRLLRMRNRIAHGDNILLNSIPREELDELISKSNKFLHT